jgi:hypothetical protein
MEETRLLAGGRGGRGADFLGRRRRLSLARQWDGDVLGVWDRGRQLQRPASRFAGPAH